MTKAASTRLTPTQISLIRMGRALFDSQIREAEQRGYIRRVHETESKPAPVMASGPIDSEAIAKMGQLLAYAPEREASAILDVMSPELLDKVLGKPDIPRHE